MATFKDFSDNSIMNKRLKRAYSFEPNFSTFWPKKIIEQTRESAKKIVSSTFKDNYCDFN